MERVAGARAGCVRWVNVGIFNIADRGKKDVLGT